LGFTGAGGAEQGGDSVGTLAYGQLTHEPFASTQGLPAGAVVCAARSGTRGG